MTLAQQLKAIINLANTFDKLDYNNRSHVKDLIESFGGKYIGCGASSCVYKIGNFVIKLGSDNFNELREFRRCAFFKKYAPTIYWIHRNGHAMICKFVDAVRIDWDIDHDKWLSIRERFKRLFEKNGYSGTDLHGGNLMKIRGKNRYTVVDYGCFCGW
jgi:hypothetical protein